MSRRASVGLLGRLLVILLIVAATEFAANTFLFERASTFALQDDDAKRMAEHLVVARRVLDRTPAPERDVVAQELSTEAFSITWAQRGGRESSSYELDNLRNQILALEPELFANKLSLHLQPLHDGGDIAGSASLTDGSVMSFRTFQTKAVWQLNLGRLLSLLGPTLVLVIIGALMIRATLRPLRTLMRMTAHVGADTAKPVPEEGPGEVRSLIHAFNKMQLRITRLITGRTQALAAVGHDLRTPLARLQLRLDIADVDAQTRQAMEQDIDEMNGLLHSLQIYLSGESGSSQPERVDLSAMCETLTDNFRDQGRDVSFSGPSSLEAFIRPVAIRRALTNLIDNALHYGGNARLILHVEGDEAVVDVEDDGPGIAPEKLAEVVQPFVRLDGARTRNTRGMGLGLAIVKDAVRAEGGTLLLENHSGGGLRATIRLSLRQR